jgi:hypothetical protein
VSRNSLKNELGNISASHEFDTTKSAIHQCKQTPDKYMLPFDALLSGHLVVVLSQMQSHDLAFSSSTQYASSFQHPSDHADVH